MRFSIHQQHDTDCLLGTTQVSSCEPQGSRNLRLHSVPQGELPPPPPRACFGRDETIEAIVGFAGNLEPVALIGAGGIGKTSIALKVLHHNRIKDRFGENRRFIRCDQFPASSTHFLKRLSKVIGAGIENPEDLAPLRPFLSSRYMILFLDNAESILDPAGPDAHGIYAVVEELSRFENICLGITSRISTVPPHCKRPMIPTLTMVSACSIFYGICNTSGGSDIIKNLVRQLDFHALSITLLATVASHNAWDYDRLAKEWETQRAQVLQTDRNESLAATIELSLSSQTFRKLASSPSPSPSRTSYERAASSTSGQLVRSSNPPAPTPSPRELLEVVAFFPQGVNENYLDWLFPTIPDAKNILDKFCLLSLTYRSNGFITMLAPIRDYLTPRDPRSSPLLCATRDRYFSRLAVEVGPGIPGFGESGWIRSEDMNVEHLLDVFTTVDPDMDDIWGACYHFMEHLYLFKPQQTVLRSKIEGLPDDHPSKPECLFRLSRLCESVGNRAEQKRLLLHTLTLERQREDDPWIALILRNLSDVNRLLGLYEEGIQQAKEALVISERLGDPIAQAWALNNLAWLLLGYKQFDAAEEAASRAITLVSKKDQAHTVCQVHRVLGEIHRKRGEREKAIHHFETVLGIAFSFNLKDEVFWIHYSLVLLFHDEGEPDRANAHIELAKLHTVDGTYNLGRVMEGQARLWYEQRRFDEAKSEALRALEVYEKLGAAKDAEDCRGILHDIERAIENRSARVDSGTGGEFLETMPMSCAG